MGTSIKSDPFKTNFLHEDAQKTHSNSAAIKKPKGQAPAFDMTTTSQSTLLPSTNNSNDAAPIISKPELPSEATHVPYNTVNIMQSTLLKVINSSQEYRVDTMEENADHLTKLLEKRIKFNKDERVKIKLDLEKAKKNSKAWENYTKGAMIVGNTTTTGIGLVTAAPLAAPYLSAPAQALAISAPQLAIGAAVGITLWYLANKSGVTEKALALIGIESKEHPNLYNTAIVAASLPPELASFVAPVFCPYESAFASLGIKTAQELTNYQKKLSNADFQSLQGDQVSLNYKNQKSWNEITKATKSLPGDGSKFYTNLIESVSKSEQHISRVVGRMITEGKA
ncbi:MAG: hypothetical protein AAF443_06380 [Chlamydiota bacterium]